MGKIRQFIVVCILGLMSISVMNPSVALADTGSQLKKQINQLEQKRKSTLNSIQNNQQELQTNNSQQSGIITKVRSIETKIQSSDYKINVKQNSIQTTQDNIKTLKDNIVMLQKRIKQRKGLIADRARAVYLNGGSKGYLQLVLNASNFNDLVSRIIFVSRIAAQDHTILQKQQADDNNLTKDQQALQVTLKQLNDDLHNLEVMKASLKSEQNTEQTLLNQLKDKASQIKKEIVAQQNQAALFKQQVKVHQEDLAQWEKKQQELRAKAQANGQASGLPSDVAQFIKPAQDLQQSTGVPAAITLAQISLESDVGGHLSGLASMGKNLFGIKGQGPAGSIYLPTHEVIGGIQITIEAGFRKYDSYYQSMVDHAKLLSKSRYQYFLTKASNLKEYAYGIQDGGYATDPYYAAKLIYIINEYHLSQFDVGSF